MLTINHSQLPVTFNGQPDIVWKLPNNTDIQSVNVLDLKGDELCNVLTLTDNRIVLITVTDGELIAGIYSDIDSAYNGIAIDELERV